jgi:hypothetical protein
MAKATSRPPVSGSTMLTVSQVELRNKALPHRYLHRAPSHFAHLHTPSQAQMAPCLNGSDRPGPRTFLAVWALPGGSATSELVRWAIKEVAF